MRNLLEFIPIIDDLVAARPALLRVVEDGLARVVQTGFVGVFRLEVFLAAAVVLAGLLLLHFLNNIYFA